MKYVYETAARIAVSQTDGMKTF